MNKRDAAGLARYRRDLAGTGHEDAIGESAVASFGPRMQVLRAHLHTHNLAMRFLAGESAEAIAADYPGNDRTGWKSCRVEDVENAIRYEFQRLRG